jgi:putative transposase
VWATCDRTPLITDHICPELYRYIRAKAESMDCPVHGIGGIEDHIHLIVLIPPKLAIAYVENQKQHHANRTLIRGLEPEFFNTARQSP